MIHNLIAGSVSHTCVACGYHRTLQVADLVAGNELDHRIIPLPVCKCGAQEHLNRTLDNLGEHAYLVNSLHEYLVGQGQVHENHRDMLANEHEKPTHRGVLSDEPLVAPEPTVD